MRDMEAYPLKSTHQHLTGPNSEPCDPKSHMAPARQKKWWRE